MTLRLAEVAALVGGQLQGDGELLISGAATLACARPGEITLCEHSKHAPQLARSQASAVVAPADFVPAGLPYIHVDNVPSAFARIVAHFRPPRARAQVGVSPQAWIHPTAQLAADVQVHPGATIGAAAEIGPGTTIHSGARIGDGCRIGAQSTIFANVVLYENTVIGDRVLIHAGAVLGAYGFGYTTVAGEHRLSAQLGYVEVGNDVEIGACTTIDRGTYGPTIIGDGAKIDNQVMIAHNCRIGRHNLVCSQVGIAGSTTTGDYVVLAGQVGIRDHVHIGERAVLGAKAGVMNDIAAGTVQVGIPATPQREQMVLQAAIAKLPEMRKQLKELLRRVEALEPCPAEKAA